MLFLWIQFMKFAYFFFQEPVFFLLNNFYKLKTSTFCYLWKIPFAILLTFWLYSFLLFWLYRGKYKPLFLHDLGLYLGESLFLWVLLLMIHRDECKQESYYWGRDSSVMNWNHRIEAISCRLSDFTPFLTAVARPLFLKSASCYPLDVFVFCIK